MDACRKNCRREMLDILDNFRGVRNFRLDKDNLYLSYILHPAATWHHKVFFNWQSIYKYSIAGEREKYRRIIEEGFSDYLRALF